MTSLRAFGSVLGLGGLSNAWRAAGALWVLPNWVADGFALAAVGSWLVCWGSLLRPLVRAPDHAKRWRALLAEPLAALVPMSTMVVSLVIRARFPDSGQTLFALAALGQLLIGIECSARLLRGACSPQAVTAAWLMPTVGGAFLMALGAITFGFGDLGRLSFGVALVSWLVTESVVLGRLMASPLPAPERATLGIYVTPAAIASVAYLSLDAEGPAVPAQLLFGYALFQALVLVRLTGWLRGQAFSVGAWAYTFGASALSLSAIRFGLRDPNSMIAALATPIFVAANALIGWVAIRTALLAVRPAALPESDAGTRAR